MCILESICRFEVLAHAKNGFLLKSFALIYACIQEVISVSVISVVNFMVVLNQLLWKKPQENEISRPKTNNSRITHTSGDKSRVTCIQVFTNHVSFLGNKTASLFLGFH